MATLRQMIDGKTLDAASAAATHVAKHVEDPYDATKGDLDDLNKSLMDYNLKRQQMKMKLAPVEQVVDGINQMHQLKPAPQIDPMTGLPMDQPDDLDDAMGNPPNMSQTPGQQNQNQGGFPPGTSPMQQMNQQRPSQVGNQPGVAPGGFNEAQVRPPKMGVPQPGQGNASTRAGFPAGWNPPGTGPNPQNNQYNPSAKPPLGNKQLPGAKGPGDPKVTKQIKKSQNGSDGKSSVGKVNIHVHADANMSPAKLTQASFAGVDMLRSCDAKMRACSKCEEEDMDAAVLTTKKRKKMKKSEFALPANKPGAGSYPIPDRQHGEIAKAYVSRYGTPEEKTKVRKAVKKKFGFADMEGFGTSEGVEKEWDSRGRKGKPAGESRFLGIPTEEFDRQENSHKPAGQSRFLGIPTEEFDRQERERRK